MLFKSNFPAIALCLFWFFFHSAVVANNANGGPDNGQPSVSQIVEGGPLGHCQPVVLVDTNCTNHTLQLSAFIYWTFTGIYDPLVVTWNTGEVAHKITVVPPGIWNWDAAITGCETYHYQTEYVQPGSFFLGALSIEGPASMCPGSNALLNILPNEYDFSNIAWSPALNISPPYEIQQPGTYQLSVTDNLGCPFSAEITVAQSTSMLSVNALDQVVCQGEAATLSPMVAGGEAPVQFLWSSGETTSSIQPNTGGNYTVIVSDACGGVDTASLNLSFIDCSCNTETFLKKLSHPGQDVRCNGVYHSGDGNLYLTAQKLDSALIIKMTPEGAILWSRSFDVKANESDNITEIIVDSEGMLVGSGYSNDFALNDAGFVFRYNPLANNMLWLRTFSAASTRIAGLVELSNGNYLIYDSQSGANSDNRMIEISRTNGSLVAGSPHSQALRLAGAESFSSVLVAADKLYGVGRYANGPNHADTRCALSRIDLTSGNVDWTRLGHVPTNAPAALSGADLLLENGHILSLSYGNETGLGPDNSAVFLQKNDLDGNLLWVKSFRLPNAAASNLRADEIVSLPDGFILYGDYGDAAFNKFLIKTDKDGNFQWSKKMLNALSEFPVQSEILVEDGHLFFVANTGVTLPILSFQGLLAKTRPDGTLDGDCNFIVPAQMDFDVAPSPASTAVNMQKVVVVENALAQGGASISTGITQEEWCPSFVKEQENISICPGRSVNIGGVEYHQDTTFVLQIPALFGCDTMRTYTITVLPLPTRDETIAFCPGSTVVLGGQNYTQPTVVTLAHPATGIGCDTAVTYTLVFATPAPSVANVVCPTAINVEVPLNSTGVQVLFDAPVASSDCVCPGINLSQTAGLSSGDLFPLGNTEVCFAASDACGQSAQCCFSINVSISDDPCDTKEIGCVRYDLLSITEDIDKNRTYRIQVTNNCAAKMRYASFQIPNGLLPVAPLNASTYVAPTGHTYRVRTPNLGPNRSVRFTALSDSISNGASDIFEYTLPAQAQVTFIEAVVLILPGTFLSAHLNTFDCPIGSNLQEDFPEERNAEHFSRADELRFFPNPADNSVWVETSGAAGQLTLFDATGCAVLYRDLTGEATTEINLADLLPGIYQALFVGKSGVARKALAVQR